MCETGNRRSDVLFNGFVFLEQRRVDSVHDLFCFSTLGLEFTFTAFGFFLIIGFKLIEGLFGVGSFKTDAPLELLIRIGFFHNAADLHFILADRIAAARRWSKLSAGRSRAARSCSLRATT